jgi:hypothetical protein
MTESESQLTENLTEPKLNESASGTGSNQDLETKEAKSDGAPEFEATPATRLIEVMGRQNVVILAIGAVLGATLLCLIGMFRPTLFPSQFGRFFLCLLIAFLFSVFVFTLYPSNYELKVGDIIRVPFVLFGPAALWIGLFLLFFYILPQEKRMGQIFRPPDSDKKVFYTTSIVRQWNPAQPEFYKVKIGPQQDEADWTTLAGFYVEFDAANELFTADVDIGPSANHPPIYRLTFARGSDTYKIDEIGRR